MRCSLRELWRQTPAMHEKYFTVLFDELKKLTNPPAPSRRKIGFTNRGENRK